MTHDGFDARTQKGSVVPKAIFEALLDNGVHNREKTVVFCFQSETMKKICRCFHVHIPPTIDWQSLGVQFAKDESSTSGESLGTTANIFFDVRKSRQQTLVLEG